MTLKNKIYNFFHQVVPLRQKGCSNVGVFKKDKHLEIPTLMKRDWSKSFKYFSKVKKL